MLNMKTRLIYGCMLSMLIFQSCENNLSQDAMNEQTKPIAFSSVIDNESYSRAMDAVWERGDQIGVFMMATGGDAVIKGNVPFVTNVGDGYFVASGNPLYYPEDGSNVDFVAYYPYDAAFTDLTQANVDVSNQIADAAPDLMVANNLTNCNHSTKGSLEFTRLMSKVVLNLNSSNNTSLVGISASIPGLKTQAVANLKEKSLSLVDNSVKEVVMHVNGDATAAEAILLPQAFSGKLKLSLTLNGATKVVETGITDKLEAGKKYVFNVNISASGGEITPDPEAKYTKWFETPVISASLLEKPNMRYIIHNTGLRYSGGTLNGIDIRNYTMLYDTDAKFAYWVAYPLCGWYLEGNVGRTDDWGYDPELKQSEQPNMKKGIGNNYDRGHQIPSGDRQRKDCKMNNQTFYFSNMTAQLGKKFNQGIWANLENKVRSWSTGVDTLYVVTGAMPTTATDQTLKYAYDNSGVQMVVPKYYFKALARKVGGSYQTIAFYLDHKDYSDAGSYMNYAVSVSELEKRTGFTFFPSLDASVKANLDLSQWR